MRSTSACETFPAWTSACTQAGDRLGPAFLMHRLSAEDRLLFGHLRRVALPRGIKGESYGVRWVACGCGRQGFGQPKRPVPAKDQRQTVILHAQMPGIVPGNPEPWAVPEGRAVRFATVQAFRFKQQDWGPIGIRTLDPTIEFVPAGKAIPPLPQHAPISFARSASCFTKKFVPAFSL
jgi:hypothetical protein